MSATWTTRKVIESATGVLQGSGVSTPKLDAELLLSHVLQTSRMQLYVDLDRPLSDAERDVYRALVRRRSAREPLQHIVGDVVFRYLTLAVRPGVLIPRSDTELLVDEALRLLGATTPIEPDVVPPQTDSAGETEPAEKEEEANSAKEAEVMEAEAIPALRVFEVGVGSGAVALSLLVECARLGVPVEVDASDLSPEAVALTLENAESTAAVQGSPLPLRVTEGSLFAGSQGRYDLIVSNPPYIPSSAIATLEPEVREYDPSLALDGGDDGLDVVRRIIADAPSLLSPGGAIALEVGAGQAMSVKALLDGSHWSDVRSAADLGRIDRVVSARYEAATTALPMAEGSPDE